MTKAAIYARVSTSEQIKGYSIDSQLELGRGELIYSLIMGVQL